MLKYESVPVFVCVSGEVPVPVGSGQFTLSGVSGLFKLHMKAHTDAGEGPAGRGLSVPIGDTH